jgi:hypothetical protein
MSYQLIPVSKFAQVVLLLDPLLPPLFSWPERALLNNDIRTAKYLQHQQELAQRAVDLSCPEPCLLTSRPLRNLPGIDSGVVAAIEERMRFGTTVELDPVACLGPSFVTVNSPKMYYDVALTRSLLAKAIAKGRIIPWPPGGPLPHFVSAMSVAFRFLSGEQKRAFNALVAQRHVMAQRLAKADLQNCIDNTGVHRPMSCHTAPLLQYRDARLYHDTSHPEGNLNTRGAIDPFRKVK